MKKKIKDLTYEEAIKICNNRGKHLPCDRCPLSFGRNELSCYRTFLQNPFVSKLSILSLDKKLIDVEREVEIDESNFD